jgi:N-acetylglucosaminyldiphosphoundecaprenol N-acetyl-beta-D-mannosaminyltransferase
VKLMPINFTWPLLETARDHNLRVYLIGSPADGRDIATVAEIIRARVSNIIIAGTASGRDSSNHPGRVSDEWLARTATAVQAAKADLVLVGMGFPLQEKVCAYLAGHLKHGIFVGEGGTFDYESFGGRQRKAPAWMQRAGLEWLWRLILQPRRLLRQAAIPRFIWRIWRSR